MSFIDDEFISKPFSLHIYLCFLACSRWEPNPEDPEEWIFGTTSWCWCGLMPDKFPFFCSRFFMWCCCTVVGGSSRECLATPGREGRCCVSLSPLFNERSCVVFLCHQVGNEMWVLFYCFDIKISSQERMGWNTPKKDNFVLLCQDSVLVWFILFFFFSFLIWFAFLSTVN